MLNDSYASPFKRILKVLEEQPSSQTYLVCVDLDDATYS